MKTKIIMVIFSLIIAGLFAVSANAQIRTVTGNFCGSENGSGAGTFAFIVGSRRMDFTMVFTRKIKLVGFEIGNVKAGREFVIKYRGEGEGREITSVVSTGRSRRIKPCDME